MSSNAPIAFFAYKRPEHTLKSLESLSKNQGAEDSELFIYSDGSKCLKDSQAVQQVREIIRGKKWCGTVHIIESEVNLGLASSIISAVTELCDRYGRVIILEDDLILSPYFLDYMNRGLELYKDSYSITQISGYMFPVELKTLEAEALFLPFTASWGWATWQRAWKYLDIEMKGYERLKSNTNLKHKFNLNGSCQKFEMLEHQIGGKIDSWAIQWYLTTFFQNTLTLYPVKSLVFNMGFDGSGIHCGTSSAFNTEIYTEKISAMPKNIKTTFETTNAVFDYLRTLNEPLSLLKRIKRKIKKLLHQIKYLKP